MNDEQIELLKKAADGADSWYAIYSRLRELVPEGQKQGYRSLVWAFGYDLIHGNDTERRSREGSPFSAFIEFQDGRLPPRLADVDAQDVKVGVKPSRPSRTPS